MKIELNKYRANVESIRIAINNKPADKSVYEVLSAFAVASHCPIIAVYHYYGELYGFDDDLLARLAMLKSFYKVSAVVGQK